LVLVANKIDTTNTTTITGTTKNGEVMSMAQLLSARLPKLVKDWVPHPRHVLVFVARVGILYYFAPPG
jgi:hypothetical protein